MRVTNTDSDYQRADSIMNYYKGGFSKALLDVFPEIGLDRSKFTAPCTLNSKITN